MILNMMINVEQVRIWKEAVVSYSNILAFAY